MIETSQLFWFFQPTARVTYKYNKWYPGTVGKKHSPRLCRFIITDNKQQLTDIYYGLINRQTDLHPALLHLQLILS